LKESYTFFNHFIKNKIFAIIISMLVGIIIWEIPNLFTQDWIYIIPFIPWEILQINIVVIIGWPILIIGPVYIYKLLLENDR